MGIRCFARHMFCLLLFGVFAFLLCKNAWAQTFRIDQAWLSAQGTSPYYLDQENATYVLDVDVSTPGTAFAIIADGVIFDLNGHTITYDNSPKIIITNASFEEGGTAWDFSAAPSADVGQGPFSGDVAWTGSQALRFSLPAGGNPDQQYVRANNPTVLQPNTTYDLSFRAYNALGGAGEVSLYAALEGTTVEAVRTGRTWRGLQLTTLTFSTGAGAQHHTIRLGVRGASNSGISSGYVYIDDIRIQRHSAHGILGGAAHWSEEWRLRQYPDIYRFGTAKDAVIKNGTITQGADGGNLSHGIYEFSADAIEVTGLTVTVHGPNSRNFGAYYASNVKIHDNIFYNNVDVITSRDAFDGQVISAGSGGEVFNNTIIGGCQNGIVSSDGSKIHHNKISLRSRYTNGFAIQLYGADNCEVYSNEISSGSGQWASRGIFVGGGAQGSKIWDNTVEVQELPINQEYNGGQGGTLSGAYGIQIESSDNIEVWGNTVTAYAREWTGSAFRMNIDTDDRNIYVHDNVFKGLKMGRGSFSSNDENLLTANSVKIDGGVDTANTQVRFEGNTLVTNSRWVACSGVSNLEFKNSTFSIENELLDTFQPLNAVRYHSDERGALVDIRFTDSAFGDEQAKNTFLSTSIYKKFYTNFGIDPYSSFRYSWSLTLGVVQGRIPVPGAQVRIANKAGQEVFSGVTNASGVVVVSLDEFINVGGTLSPANVLNPYTITVDKEGFSSVSQSVTMNKAQLLSISLECAKCPAPPRNLRVRNLTK